MQTHTEALGALTQFSSLNREKKKFYIGPDQSQISSMLSSLNLSELSQLFSHIREEVKFKADHFMLEGLEYNELAKHLLEISQKNNPKECFIADGLPFFKTTDIVEDICNIRGLTTAYTPYQPERSQGTLQSLWIYQSALSQITGFEAINASLYDRSSAIFEGIQTAIRLYRKSNKALVFSSLIQRDLEVLSTMTEQTVVEYDIVPMNKSTGTIDLIKLKEMLTQTDYACVVFPHINGLGNLEDHDLIVDMANELNTLSIAVIDPMLLAKGSLKEPAKFGSQAQGCDIIVGDAQHFAIAPNFGGPGLGIFGIRYNEANKNAIRSTPGRFIGKAQDLFGKECKSIILSTREQHIRREKATSNICSNQSFLATLAGACLLRRGEQGLSIAARTARENTVKAFKIFTSYEEFTPAFESTPFFNEVSFEFNGDVAKLLDMASDAGIHLGVNLTSQYDLNRNLFKFACTDIQTDQSFKTLQEFLDKNFTKTNAKKPLELDAKYIRTTSSEVPAMGKQEVVEYYEKLGKQNLSPDDSIYPLGSCTMKYNPYINDWAAGLSGFTNIHPAAPVKDAQGSLEILYHIQETFKNITGLAGVTTQPVAGAQGELVGLKLFQGYFKARGEAEKRNLILIPRSAHGTNPATAATAGYITKNGPSGPEGIYLINANEHGEMDLEQIKEICTSYPDRIAGIMVTNPNTAGVFETKFKEMSEIIHSVGGLVYMDGANMNAIAGWVNLNALGVDAVHNNLHKTWTIPHGGGGPGDAIVAVSDKLVDFLPGHQIILKDGLYTPVKSKNSIGEFHRHWGNFAHKVRCYSYIKALGSEGIRQMAAVAVLSSRYLQFKLGDLAPTLPFGAQNTPRMHEFILTLTDEDFAKIAQAGTPKANAIARIGKLFLDFGFHAPTVAFPETFGLMIEPTESFSQTELDEFAQKIEGIYEVIRTRPEVLQTVPHFTPISRVDEVAANKTPQVSERLTLPLSDIFNDVVTSADLRTKSNAQIMEMIFEAHQQKLQ